MPSAPMSVAFCRSPSVASGTRMNGIAEAPLHAATMCATSCQLMGLCCISIQVKSNPELATAQ